MQPFIAIKQFFGGLAFHLLAFLLRFMAKDKTTVSISETASSETRVSDLMYGVRNVTRPVCPIHVILEMTDSGTKH